MTIPQLVPLTCPSCGASIQMPEGATRYTCGYCGTEHLVAAPAPAPAPYAPYAPETAAAVSAAAAAAAAPLAPMGTVGARPRVPQPGSVSIVRDGQGARITQRWFSWKYIPLAFFAVFWDGFLCFWYGLALNSGAPAAMILFPLIHVAVGVGITYSVLAGFLNHTTVELTWNQLSVSFAPLPWLGAKTINTAEIQQLYCKETVSRGKNGTTYHYQLCALTRDNREVKFIANLDSPDIARFFEQELEGWMRIEDQPVAGEMGS